MTGVAMKRILFGLGFVAGLCELPLLIRANRETDEFMRAARTVKADVVEDFPFSGRVIRFKADNQVVKVPLERVVASKSFNEVGNQIDIAYLPDQPTEPRWLAAINRFRAGLPWLMTMSVALLLVCSVLFWRTFTTTVPQADVSLQ
jgi:hypothetical protein